MTILMVFLLSSAIVLTYTTFKIAKSTKFVWVANSQQYTTKGDETAEFWETNKVLVTIPVITNILGVVLGGLILYLG